MFELQARLLGDWTTSTGREPSRLRGRAPVARCATPPVAAVADPAHRSLLATEDRMRSAAAKSEWAVP